MFEVMKSFKVLEPATTAREILNFNSNYTTGRPIDFTDSSTFTFSSNVNDFIYDGITFNSVSAVDKYGAQEDYIFSAKGLRRKEMWWSTSSHPISTGVNNNDGFMLYGKYIMIKKIGDLNSINIDFKSISSIDVWVENYVTNTGEITFSYSSLPKVFTEKDSNNQNVYSFNSSTWKASVYNKSASSNDIVKTLNGSILSNERIIEIDISNVVINTNTNTITGKVLAGLTQNEIDSISLISPYTQDIRFTVVGEYLIQKNSTTGYSEATPIGDLYTRSSLGVSSFVYVDIPYQNNNNQTLTSKNYSVKTPSIPITFTSGNLVLVVAISNKIGDSSLPDGFVMRMSL